MSERSDDNRRTAEAIAAKLGMSYIYPEVMSDEKVEVVKMAQIDRSPHQCEGAGLPH